MPFRRSTVRRTAAAASVALLAVACTACVGSPRRAASGPGVARTGSAPSARSTAVTMSNPDLSAFVGLPLADGLPGSVWPQIREVYRRACDSSLQGSDCVGLQRRYTDPVPAGPAGPCRFTRSEPGPGVQLTADRTVVLVGTGPCAAETDSPAPSSSATASHGPTPGPFPSSASTPFPAPPLGPDSTPAPAPLPDRGSTPAPGLTSRPQTPARPTPPGRVTTPPRATKRP
ncbi:hypothetical protein [Kitasatospora sp. NPDC088134]|uniref:hypothetical protein n=1 Tax=Kitasatospora sp. NPDC088134 TaxID=3364071 RepID=UPI00381C773A